MYTPSQVLEHEFLEARCMLVELAAILDRYDRAREAAGETNGKPADARLEKLYESLSMLAARNAAPNRSERLLLHFTDPD